MSKETEVLIKTLLLQILGADTLEDAKDAIKFLSTKEDIAEAEQVIQAKKERKK